MCEKVCASISVCTYGCAHRCGCVHRCVSDLAVMKSAAWAVSRISKHWRSCFPMSKSVEQFSELILPQSNLLHEAANLRKFARNFSDPRSRLLLQSAGGRVVVPRVIDGTGSPEILVETKEAGVSFDKWLADPVGLPVVVELRSGGRLTGRSTSVFWRRESGRAPEVSVRFLGQRLARMGAHMFLQMLLFDNFVHSDLHPGNMLIRWKEIIVPEPRQYQQLNNPLAACPCSLWISRLRSRLIHSR